MMTEFLYLIELILQVLTNLQISVFIEIMITLSYYKGTVSILELKQSSMMQRLAGWMPTAIRYFIYFA